jgi:hypothetical protein
MTRGWEVPTCRSTAAVKTASMAGALRRSRAGQQHMQRSDGDDLQIMHA